MVGLIVGLGYGFGTTPSGEEYFRQERGCKGELKKPREYEGRSIILMMVNHICRTQRRREMVWRYS